jgi:hypothetical protein
MRVILDREPDDSDLFDKLGPKRLKFANISLVEGKKKLF